MAITGYHHGTEDGGESKFGKQKKFIVLNECVNVALISHVICHMASSFLRKILNNLQTGNGPGKERNQVITFFSFILNTSNTQSQSQRFCKVFKDMNNSTSPQNS